MLALPARAPANPPSGSRGSTTRACPDVVCAANASSIDADPGDPISSSAFTTTSMPRSGTRLWSPMARRAWHNATSPPFMSATPGPRSRSPSRKTSWNECSGPNTVSAWPTIVSRFVALGRSCACRTGPSGNEPGCPSSSTLVAGGHSVRVVSRPASSKRSRSSCWTAVVPATLRVPELIRASAVISANASSSPRRSAARISSRTGLERFVMMRR